MEKTPKRLNTFLDALEKSIIVYGCKGSFHFAHKTLKKMSLSKEERHSILRYCHRHGGFCDCEILYNVPRVGGFIEDAPKIDAAENQTVKLQKEDEDG